ncbi:MAG: trypsin-like serine protease [Candidatus Malihini olakiniferum]
MLTIGNPYNLGQTCYPRHYQCYRSRGVEPDGRFGLWLRRGKNFLQTDASINHGNSGGALVNTLCELVGIKPSPLIKAAMEKHRKALALPFR